MAQPTNLTSSYDVVGAREKLADAINMISPDDTPFYTRSSKVNVDNTYSEWLTDTLRASKDNKHIEGDETTASARPNRVRLGNYTQILKEAAKVSGSADKALNKAGRSSELALEMMKIGMEMRLDLEKAFFANNARVAGNDSTARELAGIPSWTSTNVYGGSGATEATGDGTDARSAGSARAFTQTMLDTALEDAWTKGGKPDVVYAPPKKVTKIATFVGSNNQRNTVDKKQISRAVDVYMTSFGTIQVEPHREMPSTDVQVIESPKWEVGVYRNWFSKELPETGDFVGEQMIGEFTLHAKNEAANASIYDLNDA